MFDGQSRLEIWREARSKKVVKPKFMSDFPGAVFGEGANELTFRAHEEVVFRTVVTTNVGNKRWGPPLVHEDWHAFCQAIFQGVEGPEWEAMYYQYKDMHQAMKSKKSGENKKAEVLRALKEAKDGGVDFYDAGHEKESKTRAQAVCEQTTGTIRRMAVLRCALEQESQVTRQLEGKSATLHEHDKEMYRIYNHN